MLTLKSLIAVLELILSGCATGTNPADPYESFNRSMYKFNDSLDKAVGKPLAKGYAYVMPTIGKVMVSNFFSNLDDVVVTANDLLQLKFRQAASDGTRVIFNSTLGIFGLFNVTSRLEKHNEDFGQTLGYWGVGPGPYLMLPLLGPSTVRDSAGMLVDTVPSQTDKITPVVTRNSLYLLNGINRRAQLLNNEKVMDDASLDRYEFLRNFYLLRRLNLVYDGDPPRQKYDDDGGGDTPDTPDTAAPASQTVPAK
jgi:phospholipid-binding lipoprotein MlaA